MYYKPTIQRFGSFRDLTRVGCAGGSDGMMFQGGVAVGSVPTFSGSTMVTTDFCYMSPAGGSRM